MFPDADSVDETGAEADGGEFSDMAIATQNAARSEAGGLVHLTIMIEGAQGVEDAMLSDAAPAIHDRSGHDDGSFAGHDIRTQACARVDDYRKWQFRGDLADASGHAPAQVIVADGDDDGLDAVLGDQGYEVGFRSDDWGIEVWIDRAVGSVEVSYDFEFACGTSGICDDAGVA